jgi:hypothetical protein
MMDAISFDYLSASDIIEKANTWTGRLVNLNAANRFRMTGVVSSPQRSDLIPVFEQAVTLLRESPGVRAVVREEEIDSFLPEIERDLSHK